MDDNQLARAFLIGVLAVDLTEDERRDLFEVSFSYNVRGLVRHWLPADVVADVVERLQADDPNLVLLGEALSQPESASGRSLRQALRAEPMTDADLDRVAAIVGSSY